MTDHVPEPVEEKNNAKPAQAWYQMSESLDKDWELKNNLIKERKQDYTGIDQSFIGKKEITGKLMYPC